MPGVGPVDEAGPLTSLAAAPAEVVLPALQPAGKRPRPRTPALRPRHLDEKQRAQDHVPHDVEQITEEHRRPDQEKGSERHIASIDPRLMVGRPHEKEQIEDDRRAPD